MRIMVLDDDRALGRAFGRILRGNEIIVEHDAGPALDRIERGERFDLVLCDLHMPGADGLEIIAMMKAHYKADAPLFVVMTGDETLPASGADVFIRKPFSIEEMRGLVTRARERKEQRTEATTAKHVAALVLVLAI